MNISKTAKLAEMPVKTLRYYDEIGLVKPSARSAAGYREYDQKSLRRLIFIRRSRAFGFSIKECRELLGLYTDENRSSADVKAIAKKRVVEIEKKQAELQALHQELSHLVDTCQGNHKPNCPIIDYLG